MARHKRPTLVDMDAAPVMPDTVDEMYDIFRQRESKPLLRDVRIDLIEPNPFQARTEFADIDELAQAIRRQGFTSRLRIRPHPEVEQKYQLVYGERRLRAALEAGLIEVPCEIVRHTDVEMAEIGLVENIQRRDLTPLEEAQALKTLMQQRDYSQRELAERLGKSHGYVQHRLDLLRAPADVQELVAQRPDSLKAARNIARLTDPAQRKPLIAAVSAGTLTSQEVVEQVQALASTPQQPAEKPQASPAIPPLPEDKAAHQVTRSSAMMRILEQERLREDIKFSRWRQALQRATPTERQTFASYLRQNFLPQAEALLRAAEGADKDDS